MDDSSYTFVDDEKSLVSFIDTVSSLPSTSPALYIDLEGDNLSRLGTVSIVTILVHPKNHTYLVDITKLSKAAFTTAGKDGKTLKDILEDPAVPKCFFDVRNDSDALFFHFGIALQGIEDIQLMENASRRTSKRLLSGLAKCVEYDCPATPEEKESWKAAKEKGSAAWDPAKGGSFEVWDKRPLPKELLQYAVQDVQLLPRLRDLYLGRLNRVWKAKLAEETLARVALSQSPNYSPQGRDKALGPWPPSNAPSHPSLLG